MRSAAGSEREFTANHNGQHIATYEICITLGTAHDGLDRPPLPLVPSGDVTRYIARAPRLSARRRFLEFAVRHQPVEAALPQIVDAHTLELPQRIGQRTAQQSGHALRIAMRATERFIDNL